MACRTTPKNTNCDRQLPEERLEQRPLSVCMPLGLKLVHDGNTLSVTGNPSVPDGVYNEIVVSNGCINTLRVAPLPTITPAPCTPGAGGSGGGGSFELTLDPSTANLLSWNLSGALLGRVFISSSASVQVSGNGTAATPFTLEATPTEATRTYITPGTASVIPISGQGTLSQPFIISHGTAQSGTFNGMTFDSHGHLTSYTAPEVSGIVSINQGPGVSVTTVSGVATVALPVMLDSQSDYLFGGWAVRTDIHGRMTAVSQNINIDAGTYDPFALAFTLNSTGSVTGLTPIHRFGESDFSGVYQPGRTETSLTFTRAVLGNMRISYKGNLGAATDYGLTASAAGLVSLLSNVPTLTVDGVAATLLAYVAGGQVLGLEALFTSNAAPDTSHTITLTRNQSVAFTDIAILDVTLCR